MGLGKPVAFVVLGFAAGVAAGWFAFRGATQPDFVRPSEDPGNSGGSTDAEGAASSPPTASSTTKPESPAGSATPNTGPAATLTAPIGDPGVRLRRLVAEAGKKALGEDLLPEYLEEAVRRAKEGVDALPGQWGKVLADRQALRKKYGELGDPWEIVVQVRATDSLHFEFGDLSDQRSRRVFQKAPLDLTRPLESRQREESLFVKSGVVPLDKQAVLEEVEIRGQFGTTSRPLGDVEVRIGGNPFPIVRGKGTTHVRFGGSVAAGWWWTGVGSSDGSIEARSVAAEVVFRGRMLPRDLSLAVPRKAFSTLAAEGDGYLSGGPVRMQIVTGHGGGNGVKMGLDGPQEGRIDALSDHPIWDNALALKAEKRASGFASGTGILPPGKAFRLRRVEWRVRMAEPDNGAFRVQVEKGDLDLVKGEGLLSSGDRPEKRRGREAPREEFRSGIWTGDLLIRAGEESRTSLECAYYVMGEAVFIGELIDDPK